MKHRNKISFAVTVSLALLTGCAIGPDYKRPAVEVGTAYKEMTDWKPAEPKDELIRGKWWEVFADAELNALAAQINVSNQSLKAAEARYRQAVAGVQSSRSALFPNLSATTGATRARAASRGGATPETTTAYNAGLNSSWEIDVWGRVRRQVEASSASAEASDADLEAVRLSLQSELAINYFQLRVTDEQKQLLDDTVAAYKKSLELTNNRYNVGVAAKGDVVQAQAQLRSTEAQALDLGVTRAQLEHAIATLIGKAPSAFSLAPKPFTLKMPRMPLGVPSTLLERRPDIAAAERRVAAANAQIGVAKAAYFPTLSLSGNVSQNSSTWSKLFSAANRSWSLGPDLALTLLDFGKRGAANDSAVAAYDQTVATYRQTVLDALQEVEDNLAALHILEEEAVIQADAVRLARESVLLTTNQYKAGTVSYLNVVTVQASQLSNERTAVSLLGRRLNAAVGLIRALGGGWAATEMAEQK
ncbi:MAG: efflux transporter outer membrane subunit [Betaproteobacteria bacterium]|nr:efflux transporter outer membrane subunit [Betaproteobacteria bacterium]